MSSIGDSSHIRSFESVSTPSAAPVKGTHVGETAAEPSASNVGTPVRLESIHLKSAGDVLKFNLKASARVGLVGFDRISDGVKTMLSKNASPSDKAAAQRNIGGGVLLATLGLPLTLAAGAVCGVLSVLDAGKAAFKEGDHVPLMQIKGKAAEERMNKQAVESHQERGRVDGGAFIPMDINDE